MNVKAGDRAVIVKSVDGINIGKVVDVVEYRGQHSKLGTIWHIRSHGTQLITEYGAVGYECDCADEWLRPLLPLADAEAIRESYDIPMKLAA